MGRSLGLVRKTFTNLAMSMSSVFIIVGRGKGGSEFPTTSSPFLFLELLFVTLRRLAKYSFDTLLGCREDEACEPISYIVASVGLIAKDPGYGAEMER